MRSTITTQVAGFDPIFFLHHSNVDRLLSLWSGLDPDVVVNESPNDKAGTFTLPPNVTVNSNTDFSPFWDSKSTFWTSIKLFDDDRHFHDTDKLGYTYPEFVKIDRNDSTQAKDAVKESLYKTLKNTPENF